MYENEGHGFHRTDRFLAKHLGGRAEGPDCACGSGTATGIRYRARALNKRRIDRGLSRPYPEEKFMPPTPVEGVGFQRSRWSVRVCATRSWRAASTAQPPWVTCRLTNASSTRSYWAT